MILKEQTKGKQMRPISDWRHLVETGEIKVEILNIETISEKEYAKELVYFFEMQTFEQMTHTNAKECALKVVQEIKKHNERFNFSSYNFEEGVNSLLLVEKEIEKL